MSLRWYIRPRMVVLNRSSSALEAARAIENNKIGAVVVQEHGRIVGILTDRDLAVRVVGQGLDAERTTVGDIMSTGLATLTPDDEQSDAVRLMLQRKVRRIPLVENERIVGMVTLDDLLLDEAASLDRLAAIVQSQIGAGGPAPTMRSPRWRRSAARAEATYRRLLNHTCERSGLESTDEAEVALEVVLESVVQRLTPDEADDLISQLPSLLQPTLQAMPPGPDKTISRETIERELARRLEVEPARAKELLNAVGSAIADRVSSGQMDDVRNQLPAELRGAFESAPPSVE